MSKFQLILTGIFAIFIIVGVLFFATSRGGNNLPTANVTVWGTFDEAIFLSALDSSPTGQDDSINITYVQKEESSFDQELIEALASSTGPDIILISQDAILKHQNKLFAIPFETYSERTFRDLFIESGELSIFPEGIYSIPVLSDPVVMYWNRTMFNNANLSRPPIYWNEFFGLSEKMTKKDETFGIEKSAVSLGEYLNIKNAKEILSMLINQAGNPIVQKSGSNLSSVLDQKPAEAQGVLPAVAALNFYVEFSNPVKPFYSWNRSLPEAQDVFLSGDLALYFGFASELYDIRQKNPNLNFDIAHVPQSLNTRKVQTYGDIYSLAITKNSKDISGALRTIISLTSKETAGIFSSFTGLPPVRRDLLAEAQTDPYLSIFYDSALHSWTWLDPDKELSENIFKNMIENVTSGRMRTTEAIGRADAELNALFKN